MGGKGRAGTHTSVIAAADEIVPALEKLGRVSRGVIRANAGAAGRSVKVVALDGCVRLTVVAKGARQEFHVYGVPAERIREVFASPRFRSFTLNITDA